ncbi:MAG: hypothetical protein JSS51_03980 [Planctomycetes bacterium]|nr:hypothetical protein [Planctomycetota bacterium]
MDFANAYFNGLSGGLAEDLNAADAAGMNLVTYPGWSTEVAGMFALVGAALTTPGVPLPISNEKVAVTKRTFWHAVALDTQTRVYKFFNVGSTPFVTNMAVANQFPAENAFWCTNIRASFKYDGAAALNYTRLMSDYVRNLFENSETTFKIGDRVVIDRLLGLKNFPEGGGVDYKGLIPETAISPTTASSYLGRPTNGDPTVQNKFEMVPTPIIPAKNFSFQTEFAAALSASTGFTNPYLVIGLEGYLVAPANN